MLSEPFSAWRSILSEYLNQPSEAHSNWRARRRGMTNSVESIAACHLTICDQLVSAGGKN
jgi:hypothetical protein